MLLDIVNWQTMTDLYQSMDGRQNIVPRYQGIENYTNQSYILL